MNQKSNHLVLSHSYELNKGKTLLYFIFKRQRGTEKTRPNKKRSELKLYAFEIQRKTSFANRSRRCKYIRTGKPLKFTDSRRTSKPELTQAIDLRSIYGRLLRITRINTDRFKQLSNTLKSALDRCLKNRTTRTVQTAEAEGTETPLFTCGSTSYKPEHEYEAIHSSKTEHDHALYTENPIHRKQTNR